MDDDKKTGFFEEAPGVASSTRLVFVAGTAVVLAMAALMTWRGEPPLEIGAFVSTTMAALGATKIAGAWQEKEKKDA